MKDNIGRIKSWIWRLLLCAVFVEVVFYPALENIYGCVTFILVWGIVDRFVFTQKNLHKLFLPTLALFGLAFCFFFLPLLMTLIEFKPLTFRFQVPYLTFTHQFINYIMLASAYLTCLYTYHDNNWLHRLWKRFGYFKAPSVNQVWAIGFIGILSLMAMLSIQGTDKADSENLGVVGHLISRLSGFSSIPVCLLFTSLYCRKDENRKPSFLYIYLVSIVILGIATTRRSIIFSAFMSILICYIILIFLNKKQIFKTKNFFIFCFLFYMTTGPLSDMAMAMILNRSVSYDQSSSSTFQSVVELYQDKEKLHSLYNLRISDDDNYGNNDIGWSEYYVDNIFFDRICNIRVCDATIYYAYKLGLDNPKMQDYFYSQILFLIPTPILKAFGVTINKFGYQFSPGDLISTNGLGLRNQYHGYRVAGDVGIGLYLWGIKYYIFAFFIYFIFFFFIGSLVKHVPTLLIPAPIVVGLFGYMNYFNNTTGLVRIVSAILRTGWEGVLLYCILFAFVRRIIK